MVERMIGTEHGTGGSSGAALSGAHARVSLLSRALGGAHVPRRGNVRLRPALRPQALATAAAVSDPRAPRRIWSAIRWARRRCGAQDRARTLLGRMGERRPRGVGDAGLPRIAAIADGIGAIVGAPRRHVFLGPNVSVLQAALATCIDFSRRAQRSRLRSAAVSVADVRVARMGALRRRDPRRTLRRRANDSDRAHLATRSPKRPRSSSSRTRTTSPARSPTCARSRRAAAASGALLCVDAYQTTGIYPYDVTQWDLDVVTGGSHKWLLRRPGLRLDLRQAVAARAHSRPR